MKITNNFKQYNRLTKIKMLDVEIYAFIKTQKTSKVLLLMRYDNYNY